MLTIFMANILQQDLIGGISDHMKTLQTSRIQNYLIFHKKDFEQTLNVKYITNKHNPQFNYIVIKKNVYVK